MVLVFVRHGPAGSADAARWPDDRARPLTPRGADRTRLALKGLVRLVPTIDRVWTSPLVRARETADLLRRVAPTPPPVEVVEELAPAGRALPLLREWMRRAKDETLVVVGHEPDLSSLAAALSGLRAGGLALKKAGVVALTLEPGAGPASAGLAFFVPPRALRAMARGKKPSHKVES
jgi:phosphohistidine phosphatase